MSIWAIEVSEDTIYIYGNENIGPLRSGKGKVIVSKLN